MADRELSNKLSSGELTQIKLNGTASSNILKTAGENEAQFLDKDGTLGATKLPLTPSPQPAHVEGQMYYNSTSKTFNFQGPFPGIELKAGHENHIHVINNSGTTILKGSAVRQNGVVGGKIQIEKALADNFTNSIIFGITAEDIINGAESAITTFGEIDALDTSLLTSGVPLYLSDTVAGTFSEIPPAIVSQVGGVLVTDPTVGILFVSINNNTNLPTVFGGLQGQTLGNETYSLTTVSQDIINYLTETIAATVVDGLLGTITISNAGEYRVHFTSAITFITSTSTRSVTLELYDVTNATVIFSYVKNIPRNATEDSLSFSWPISELAGNTSKIRIKASVAMDVTFNNVSFDMQSVSIR